MNVESAFTDSISPASMRTDQQFGRTEKHTPVTTRKDAGTMVAGGGAARSAVTGPYLDMWSCSLQLYQHGPSSGSDTVATHCRNAVLHSGNFRYCHLRPQASDWSCDLCSVCQTSCHTCTPTSPGIFGLLCSEVVLFQGKIQFVLVREGTCSVVVLELQSDPPVSVLLRVLQWSVWLVLMTGADVSAGGRQQ